MAWLTDAVISLILAAIAWWHLIPAIETTPFHRDEARWIHRAYLLKEWRHPLGPRWQDDGYPIGEGSWDERYRMRDQPPLAPYVLGLGLLIQGHDLDVNGFWIMDYDDAWNVAHGNMPPEADLRAARRTDVTLGAVTVGIVYWLGLLLVGRIGGVVAALFLTFNPLMLDTTTRAWSDPLLLLLTALSIGLAFRLAERPSWARAATLGVVLGLGGATKLSPLLIALGLGGLGLALIWIAKRRLLSAGQHVGFLGRRLLAVPPVTFLTFVAVYPYLWTDPIGHTYRMFAFRADSFASQARGFPGAAVDSRTEALERMVDTSAWFSTARWVAAEFGHSIGFSAFPAIGPDDLDLLIALLGAAILGWRAVRRGQFDGVVLASLMLAGQVVLVFLTIRVDYPRYHLPVILVVSILVGVAADRGALVAHVCLSWLIHRTRIARPGWSPNRGQILDRTSSHRG